MKTLLSLALLFAALLCAGAARAHGTRSVSVDVFEVAPGRAVVHVRAMTAGDAVKPSFSEPCRTIALAAEDEEEESAEGRLSWSVECPGALAGTTITLAGLGPIVTEAVVLVSFHDGKQVSRVLNADEPSFRLPEEQTALAVARGYIGLGVKHIFTGYDHLLFLLSLVLLLKRPRAVLLAETAFTASHTLSFSATALGLLHVSSTAAEACIAWSLVLVALDIGRRETSARRGAGLAFIFGLVHGLGFAGGLSEIGLPDHHASLALIGFATGVEIGQVAFLALALLALSLAARRTRLLRHEPAAALLIGGISSYWLIERTLACLAARV